MPVLAIDDAATIGVMVRARQARCAARRLRALARAQRLVSIERRWHARRLVFDRWGPAVAMWDGGAVPGEQEPLLRLTADRLLDVVARLRNAVDTADHAIVVGSLIAELEETARRLATTAFVVDVALQRSDQLVGELQHALQSRIVIEQAKGVLAERCCIDIPAAFAMLRQYARANNDRVSDVAQEIDDGTLSVRDLLFANARRPPRSSEGA